jgi:enamine deaminase RidA (YjgF/YER057c/UK114 family)
MGMGRFQRALAELGGSLKDVLKLTFFLKDMRDLRTVERIHRRFFPGGAGGQPTVTVFGVDELGVHDFLLEIEMIADLGSSDIYMTDHNDLPAVEAATRAVFPRRPPAVTVVGVTSLPVPGAGVQIEAVAGARGGGVR